MQGHDDRTLRTVEMPHKLNLKFVMYTRGTPQIDVDQNSVHLIQ